MKKMTAAEKCWEFKKCGREAGGQNAHKLGVCPASILIEANGINNGKNGGRACWAITGTFCKGEVQGSYAKKITNCLHCEFYQLVRKEEGMSYLDSIEILRRLRKKTLTPHDKNKP